MTDHQRRFVHLCIIGRRTGGHVGFGGTSRIPLVVVPTYEQACRGNFASVWLAASAGKLVIDMPAGRKAEFTDVMNGNSSCAAAPAAAHRFLRRPTTRCLVEVCAPATSALEGADMRSPDPRRRAAPRRRPVRVHDAEQARRRAPLKCLGRLCGSTIRASKSSLRHSCVDRKVIKDQLLNQCNDSYAKSFSDCTNGPIRRVDAIAAQSWDRPQTRSGGRGQSSLRAVLPCHHAEPRHGLSPSTLDGARPVWRTIALRAALRLSGAARYRHPRQT